MEATIDKDKIIGHKRYFLPYLAVLEFVWITNIL